MTDKRKLLNGDWSLKFYESIFLKLVEDDYVGLTYKSSLYVFSQENKKRPIVNLSEIMKVSLYYFA